MGRGDIEAGLPHAEGGDALYPYMIESPQLRWGFIRKVYVIISLQLLFTAAFSSLFIFFTPARNFARYNQYRIWKHPVNLLLLGLYTLCMSVTVGFACSFVDATIVLEAAFLTGVVTASLTFYTFWAVKRGSDFSFLGPFLFASLMVMLLFALIQVFYPLGPIGRMVIACIGAIVMCGFIVYDTDDLIKRYTYDDYIWAAIAIYGDIINLFIYLLTILNDLF
ncbi:hypothetical protein JHK86_055990 [Glycine max]|nr:hypothetical protein JHK86_055990 [Glycine max]